MSLSEKRIRKIGDETMTKTTINYGSLCDAATGETIRPATCDERNESLLAGPEGIIAIDGRSYYVEGDDENSRPEAYHDGYEAAMQGDDDDACQYAKGTWERAMWIAGYRDAE